MDNKELLINSALNLFSNYGYDAVGVQRIVEEAGLTKPTLYHYFGSKKGLLDVLLNTKFKELFLQLEQAAAYQGDIILTLTRIANVYFEFSKKHPQFYRMQLSMWFAPVSSEAYLSVAAYNDWQQRLIEQVFIQAVEQHGNMTGRHQAYTATFLGMINTYVTLGMNGQVSLSDELVYRAVHQFMHGIFS